MSVRSSTALAILAIAAATLPTGAHAQDAGEIVAHYADMALAKYQDSLETARALDTAIEAFLSSPSAETHAAAKAAWLAARVPYQQTEAYRFGNPAVDAWEGKVNAWPLDEGLIDYVDAGFYGDLGDLNAFYAINIIANPEITVGGDTIDAATIDHDLLRSLHEIDEVEANVSTGYRAIEFLLWGQDLNGTGPGAGERPWTDYASGEACTHGHCDRRGAYLAAASDLLVADLEDMVVAWDEGGEARTTLTEAPAEAGITAILTGLGSLSYGELAGERMQLGLMLHDPEEEHDCFADNTHNSHYYNRVGMENVYRGRYERLDGTVLEGPALADLVAAADPDLDAEMRAKLEASLAALGDIKSTADSGEMAYDQMIGKGNDKGNALVQTAIDALVDQTRTIERIVAALDLGAIAFEGSDSLDDPEAVFQ
jgi:putative iron-regulated protein